MSQENVRVKNEVIRRLFWAFENDTAAFRATLHPEIEWFPIDENRRRLYGIEPELVVTKAPDEYQAQTMSRYA